LSTLRLLLLSARLDRLHFCYIHLTRWRRLQLHHQRRASLPSSLLRRTQAPFLQTSYSLTVINVIISFGLVYLSWRSLSSRDSSPPIPYPTAGLLIPAVFFGLTNIFLVVVPITPPPRDAEPYERLAYWTHVVGGWALFGVGFLWWAWRRHRERGRGGGKDDVDG